MDESEAPSWKGHSFTLLVFGGIVVLCSIFFVLGMLVGRNQGQRMAEAAAADVTHKTAAQPLPEGKSLDAIFTQTTESTADDTLQPRVPPAAATEGPEPAPAVTPAPNPPPAPAATTLKEPVTEKRFLQIAAVKDSKGADQAVDKVKSKGFQARILPPSPESTDGYFRVWVGPYDTDAEADMAVKELEALGYKGVVRK